MTATHAPPAPAAELLDYAGAAALLGMSQRTVLRLTKVDPTFPPKVLVGSRVRFRRADLLGWISGRPAAG